MAQIRMISTVFAPLSGWLLLAASASCGEKPELQVGDQAPDFTVTDDEGHKWRLRDHLGQKFLVLYFFPSDFGFCDTRQACRYRDDQQALAQRKAEVVGISGDSVRAHRLFKEANSLTFSLLSDGDGNVATLFGVPLRAGGKALATDAAGHVIVDSRGNTCIPRRVTAARWTFVIDKTGRVIYRETSVTPVKDSQQVLQFLRQLDSASIACVQQ